jgi:tetratricopeptide (TPR) repeat protein
MLKRLPLFFLMIFMAGVVRLWAEDPSANALNHFQSGLAYERLGRYDDAYTQLQLAANLEPENPQMALALGIVASRLGRYDEAVRALEHSIAIDANSTASYFELALLYENKNLSDRALECWHRFAQLNQDQPLKTLAKKHIDYLQGHS